MSGAVPAMAQRASCDRRARLSALHLRICRPGRAYRTGNVPVHYSELLAGGSCCPPGGVPGSPECVVTSHGRRDRTLLRLQDRL